MITFIVIQIIRNHTHTHILVARRCTHVAHGTSPVQTSLIWGNKINLLVCACVNVWCVVCECRYVCTFSCIMFPSLLNMMKKSHSNSNRRTTKDKFGFVVFARSHNELSLLSSTINP